MSSEADSERASTGDGSRRSRRGGLDTSGDGSRRSGLNTATIADRRAELEREFDPWRSRTLDEHFERAAQRFGSRPYVIAGAKLASGESDAGDRVFTYDDVLRRAHRFADGLAELGVRPGDHIALLMANYPEYAPLKVAISRVGAVAVPLNYLYRTDELGFVLHQSCSRLLITMTSYRDMDYLAMLDELAPGWERAGSIGLGELNRVITLDPEGKGAGAGRRDRRPGPGADRRREPGCRTGRAAAPGPDVGHHVHLGHHR